MFVSSMPLRMETRRPAGTGPRFAALTRDERIDLHLDRTEQPAFQQAFQQVIDRAQAAIQQKLAAGGQGFVIFDVDETSLDNRGFFRDPQRQYYKGALSFPALKLAWDSWVHTQAIPAIPATKALIGWLNQVGVKYCFMTGIKEYLKPSSFRNLKNEGLVGPHCLGGFYRPDNEHSTSKFKIAERTRLEQQFGMPIWASVGDMPRDMTGRPDADFLLPGYAAALRKEND